MAHSLPATVTAIAPAKRREPLLLLSHLCRDKTSPNPRHTNKSHLTGSGVLESQCIREIDGTELRPDGMHYSDDSATLIVPRIVKALFAALGVDT